MPVPENMGQEMLDWKTRDWEMQDLKMDYNCTWWKMKDQAEATLH